MWLHKSNQLSLTRAQLVVAPVLEDEDRNLPGAQHETYPFRPVHLPMSSRKERGKVHSTIKLFRREAGRRVGWAPCKERWGPEPPRGAAVFEGPGALPLLCARCARPPPPCEATRHKHQKTSRISLTSISRIMMAIMGRMNRAPFLMANLLPRKLPAMAHRAMGRPAANHTLPPRI